MDGVLDGNLYLRGGGDPSFSRAEARGFARVLAGSGLTHVDGRVVGDESRFDGLRGGPDSNYGVSVVGRPAERAAFNHGYTLARRPRFQRNPPLYAAQNFQRELSAPASTVRRAARGSGSRRRAPSCSASGHRPDDRAGPHTNRPSDNYMAETLLKALGADFGGGGTTAAGAPWRAATRPSTAPSRRSSTAPA